MCIYVYVCMYVYVYIRRPCVPEIPTLFLQEKKVERKNHRGGKGVKRRRKCWLQ